MTDVVVSISPLVPRQSRLWCSLLTPLVPDFFATLAPSALFVSPLYTLYCTAAADVVAAIRRWLAVVTLFSDVAASTHEWPFYSCSLSLMKPERKRSRTRLFAPHAPLMCQRKDFRENLRTAFLSEVTTCGLLTVCFAYVVGHFVSLL